jgi:hypothetical protein
LKRLRLAGSAAGLDSAGRGCERPVRILTVGRRRTSLISGKRQLTHSSIRGSADKALSGDAMEHHMLAVHDLTYPSGLELPDAATWLNMMSFVQRNVRAADCLD